MKRVCCSLLAVLALAVASALVGCGGSKSHEAATGTPADSTPSTEAFLGGVPVYPGATIEINSGADAPGVALVGSPAAPPADHNVDVENYSDVKTAIYQTSDSPSQVLDWYQSNMAGWHEEWSSNGDDTATALATGIWTKDNGKEAAWMAASTLGRMTMLLLWSGS